MKWCQLSGRTMCLGALFTVLAAVLLTLPKLLGWSSNELGHRNYQHPSRTEHDFGHSLDDFSANLIYWSLRIIATYPFPDDLLNYESEGLIFSREDFIAPERSPAFRFLEHHERQEVGNAPVDFGSCVIE